MLTITTAAMETYAKDERDWISHIHIPNKPKLLARKIADKRIIDSIENMKEVLLTLYENKLPLSLRYTLFVSIQHISNYLSLMTQNDWPVDRDIPMEIDVLRHFKDDFQRHLTQISNYLIVKEPQTETNDIIEKLILATQTNLASMEEIKSVADISRFIQFIAYICNDINDFKYDIFTLCGGDVVDIGVIDIGFKESTV